MATTTSITTTYAGEKLNGFISAALLSGVTLDSGKIKVLPNVKYKAVMQRLETGDLIQADSCDFTASGSVTLTEKTITPFEMKVNKEICKSNFHSDWLSVEQGFSAHDNLPTSFQDYLMAKIAAGVAEKVEQNIWNGDNGSDSNAFDGIVTKAIADTGVVDVTGTASSVDASTIIAELGKVVDAIPSTIYGKEDLYIYMSQADARSYVRAQAALGYRNLFHDGTTDMNFEGVNLFVTNGLNSGQMVAAQAENLQFATGLINDYNDARLIDLSDIDGSDNIRIVMKFTGAADFAIAEEVVLYQTGVA